MQKDGLYIEYFDAKEKTRKSFECTYKNGVYDGLYTRWYFSGMIELQCTWKDGKLHEKCTRWFDHGMQELCRIYEDGVAVYDVPHPDFCTSKEEMDTRVNSTVQSNIPRGRIMCFCCYVDNEN